MVEAEVAQAILLGLAIIGVSGVIIGLAYINYLQNKGKKERKPDPIWRAVFITLALVLMSIVGESVGAFEQGFTKKYWWVFFVIFVCVLAVYLYIARLRNPMPTDKLYNKASEWVDHFYSAEQYIGDAYIDPMDVLKVDEMSGMKEMLRSGVFSVLVSRKAIGNIVQKFFVQLNVYTGYLLYLQVSPPYVLEKRIVEQYPTMPRSGLVEEFGLEDKRDEEAEPTEKAS